MYPVVAATSEEIGVLIVVNSTHYKMLEEGEINDKERSDRDFDRILPRHTIQKPLSWKNVETTEVKSRKRSRSHPSRNYKKEWIVEYESGKDESEGTACQQTAQYKDKHTHHKNKDRPHDDNNEAFYKSSPLTKRLKEFLTCKQQTKTEIEKKEERRISNLKNSNFNTEKEKTTPTPKKKDAETNECNGVNQIPIKNVSKQPKTENEDPAPCKRGYNLRDSMTRLQQSQSDEKLVQNKKMKVKTKQFTKHQNSTHTKSQHQESPPATQQNREMQSSQSIPHQSSTLTPPSTPEDRKLQTRQFRPHQSSTLSLKCSPSKSPESPTPIPQNRKMQTQQFTSHQSSAFSSKSLPSKPPEPPTPIPLYRNMQTNQFTPHSTFTSSRHPEPVGPSRPPEPAPATSQPNFYTASPSAQNHLYGGKPLSYMPEGSLHESNAPPANNINCTNLNPQFNQCQRNQIAQNRHPDVVRHQVSPGTVCKCCENIKVLSKSQQYYMQLASVSLSLLSSLFNNFTRTTVPHTTVAVNLGEKDPRITGRDIRSLNSNSNPVLTSSIGPTHAQPQAQEFTYNYLYTQKHQ